MGSFESLRLETGGKVRQMLTKEQETVVQLGYKAESHGAFQAGGSAEPRVDLNPG